MVVRRPGRSSARDFAPQAQRRLGVPAAVAGDLKARVTAERLQQGLPAQITDLTVLRRLALRIRQAASAPPLPERTSTQTCGPEGTPAGAPQMRVRGPHGLAIRPGRLGRVPGPPDAA